ncbi:hypothetical protein EDB86DRAFT_1454797 [Lactarius hatsudake]|nr:hypothetical protein EDB86DRAFT_1454797 [Lactarius hatsudake]
MPILGLPSIVLTSVCSAAYVTSYHSKCLTTTDLRGHHLILAVILILKHATLLRLSNLSPISALTNAELDYRAADIDVNIQQYLMTSSQEHSVELFAAFIMAIDILPSQSSAIDICLFVFAFVRSISNHAFSAI